MSDSLWVPKGDNQALATFRDYLKANALESFFEVADTFVAFSELQACRISSLPDVFRQRVTLLYRDSKGYWNLSRKLAYAYSPISKDESGTYVTSPNRFSTLELPSFFNYLLASHKGRQSKHEEAMSFSLTHYCQWEKIVNGSYSDMEKNIKTYIRDDLSLSEALFFLSLPSKEPIAGEKAAQFLASGGGSLPIDWIAKMLSSG